MPPSPGTIILPLFARSHRPALPPSAKGRIQLNPGRLTPDSSLPYFDERHAQPTFQTHPLIIPENASQDDPPIP
jgi:hypothetical protein